MKEIELKKSGVNSLESRYIKKNTLNHSTGNQFKILPFKTNPSGDDFTEDYKDFQGVVGELFRLAIDKSLLESDNGNKSYKSELKKIILENALKRVTTENPSELKSMLSKLFFEEDDSLIKFSTKTISYMNFNSSHNAVKEISRYIYDIFLTDNSADILHQEIIDENILHQLIIECLPELDNAKSRIKRDGYINLFPEITAQFRKDLNFLVSDQTIFLKHLEDFFKYNYFNYLSQLILKLNNFGIDDTELRPIHFTLDWETLSESRLAGHSVGWKYLNRAAEQLFVHSNTVEFLNYILVDGESLGDYRSIIEKTENFSIAEKEKFIDQIKEITDFYTSYITNFKVSRNWEECASQLESSPQYRKIENEVAREIFALWYKIKYQFEHTERKGADDKYAKWFIAFAKVNYTKSRGRLGATMVLSQEQLLFLTKLCIGNENKIRLKSLWERLKLRGIVFDETSKIEITKLFERINLIEKKSDSGDAQYIKSTI